MEPFGGFIASTLPAGTGVRAALRRGAQWAHADVAAAMSRPVLTIEAGESLWDAWLLLSISGLRHLVVVDDGRCLGVLPDRTILADLPVSEEGFRQRTVGALVAGSTLPPVHDHDALAEIARIMARDSVQAVPVLDDDGRPIGIVTGSDLVRWWADDGV